VRRTLLVTFPNTDLAADGQVVVGMSSAKLHTLNSAAMMPAVSILPHLYSPLRKQPINSIGGLQSDYIRLIVRIVIHPQNAFA
jgi:hypothetical protein